MKRAKMNVHICFVKTKNNRLRRSAQSNKKCKCTRNRASKISNKHSIDVYMVGSGKNPT